jgi:branched-chain amino acid transport system ATP-binding protein
MTVLRVESLIKHFGGLHVLQDISFTIEAKEKLAIIGPNGAGKTTLFNVIAGQLPLTSGHIYLNNVEITNLPPYRRLHLGLSRSFQINNLFLKLPVIDNVVLALKGARHPHFQMLRPMTAYTDIFVKAQDLLESMGLWEFSSTPISALSYGDQRLVEVALALTSKPKLVLLDEPTAGLSAADAANFSEFIRKFLENTTVIFCAHDMDLVFNLADRIIVLDYGQIIAQGKPLEIQENSKVREVYLGRE